MSTSTSAVCISRRSVLLARASDYLELSKPRIATLVLVVVAVSAYVGSWGRLDPWMLFHALLGTALVAASASAFNQWIERRRDALMPRTADRPLPSGRLSAQETIAFGIATLALGMVYLTCFVNFATAVFGLLTWILYVVIYTPMKSHSSANTAVGAVAGALPVLMGWAAVDASFSLASGPVPGGVRVAALFLVVYLWQFPHFMAIAWIYRRQYGDAGMQMLTVVDPTGRRAGLQAVLGSLALLPVSVLPVMQLAGRAYIAGALTLGLVYLVAAAMFCWRRNDQTARGLLRASLVYLPVLLVLLIVSPHYNRNTVSGGLVPGSLVKGQTTGDRTLDQTLNSQTPDT